MVFSQATYDLVFGVADRPMRVFSTNQHTTLEKLLEHLELSVGTGGGIIDFPKAPTVVTDRYPETVLITQDGERAVGMIANVYRSGQMFGVCIDEPALIDKALEIASPVYEVNYENSDRLRHY